MAKMGVGMSIRLLIVLLYLSFSIVACGGAKKEYAKPEREYAKPGEGRLLPKKMTDRQRAIKKHSR